MKMAAWSTRTATFDQDQAKKAFAANVRKYMQKKGWYQSELARRAQLSRDQISKYCRGEALAGDEALHKLAGALGVAVSDLVPDKAQSSRDASTLTATEFKMIPGRPGAVWLKIDRVVSVSTAVAVIELLEKDVTDAA